MSTAENCRAMAEEADRLAAIVSYGRDKVRLQEQATSWRARAQAMDALPVLPHEAACETGGVFGWLRRRRG